MDFLENLLNYVRRTNPDMSRQELVKRLNECESTSYALALVLSGYEQKEKPTDK